MPPQLVTGPWRKVARVLTEVFQPPVVVLVLLLISPAMEPGFPGTLWFGLLAAMFVCVLPLAYVLVMVKLGRITDHHVSDRRQRPALLLMTLVSVLVGLLVLHLLSGPAGVTVMIIALIGGIGVLAVVSAFWKMSGHASALSLQWLSPSSCSGRPGSPCCSLCRLLAGRGWFCGPTPLPRSLQARCLAAL